jgi:hypothetical protein
LRQYSGLIFNGQYSHEEYPVKRITFWKNGILTYTAKRNLKSHYKLTLKEAHHHENKLNIHPKYYKSEA